MPERGSKRPPESVFSERRRDNLLEPPVTWAAQEGETLVLLIKQNSQQKNTTSLDATIHRGPLSLHASARGTRRSIAACKHLHSLYLPCWSITPCGRELRVSEWKTECASANEMEKTRIGAKKGMYFPFFDGWLVSIIGFFSA